MRRCLELARCGRVYASPNPMVGAVIVCDDRVIGEGYHARCGQAHAEVNAIRAVRRPELLTRSTLYVSLEPCAHYGKTPPCADLIVEKGIPRVVIGCQDPFPRVDGRGIQKLVDAGCEVRVGVLRDECLSLNRRFITFHTRRRPYVTLKWAQSADGFIDATRHDEDRPVQFSNPLTRLRVHRLRAEHSAIMVGTHTARLDNPALNVRHWAGPDPVRIVVDRRASLPDTLRMLSDGHPTLVLTNTKAEHPAARPNVEYIALRYADDVVPAALRLLYERGLQSLLVEGGARLLQSFINDGLWDEAHVETAHVRLGQGVEAPTLKDARPETEERVGENVIRTFVHREG